jgi:hypothetical protein
METATIPVPEISDVEAAFPANVLDWMPPRDEIPEEFRFMRGRSEWNEIADSWFANGLPGNVEFYPRDGVDPEKAVKAISAVLGSFAPKHEHKEEAAAYLLSCWFSKIKNWKR